MYQKGTFKHVGMWVGISITQSGPGIPFLLPSLYQYFATGDLHSIDVKDDEIKEHEMDVISKVGIKYINSVFA